MAVRPSTQSPAASSSPVLIPQGQHAGKPSLPMGRAFTLVGSRHRAHLHLLSRSVSKAHAVIVNDNGTLYIRDTASREHVLVNGERVKEAELRHNDTIVIGTFKFQLSDPSSKSRRQSAPRAPEAALEVEGSSMPVPFEGRTLLIGRRPSCDILLSEQAVSNVHAVIFELNGEHHIRDLGSRTGTFVNGEQVQKQALKFDDVIRVGDTEMRLVPGAAATIDELEHLVGTATLGSEQMLLAKADAARAAAQQIEPPLDLDDEDTIPLAEPEDVVPLKEKPPGRAVARETVPPADLAELDLNADPDLSGAGDTQAIPGEAAAETHPTPMLSSKVVDEAGVLDEVGIESDERRLLVGVDLQEDKLSASGSFANFAHDEEESLPANAELDLLPLDDDSPVTPLGGGDRDTDEPHDLHEAIVDKHVDTMYFDPEPFHAPASAMEAAPQAALTASESVELAPAPSTGSLSPTEPVYAVGSEQLPVSQETAPAQADVSAGVSPALEWAAGGADQSSFEQPAVEYAEATAEVNGVEQEPSADFDEAVPPPFPAGLAPVVAEGAVGLPGWTSVRAETAKIRKPAGLDSPTPTLSSNEAIGVPHVPDRREVFSPTEPTPESAQHLEVQIGDTWAETYAELMPSVEELSDSKFGMVMQDFAGSDLGHLVEHSGDPVQAPEPAGEVRVAGLQPQELQALAEAPDQLPEFDARVVTAHESAPLDIAQPPESPAAGQALTAHEDILADLAPEFSTTASSLAPEFPTIESSDANAGIATTAALGVDSPSNPADATVMEPAVSDPHLDAFIAREGFLPEASGDELVDQAEAFLRDEAPPQTASPDAAPASRASANIELQEWLAEASRIRSGDAPADNAAPLSPAIEAPAGESPANQPEHHEPLAAEAPAQIAPMPADTEAAEPSPAELTESKYEQSAFAPETSSEESGLDFESTPEGPAAEPVAEDLGLDFEPLPEAELPTADSSAEETGLDFEPLPEAELPTAESSAEEAGLGFEPLPGAELPTAEASAEEAGLDFEPAPGAEAPAAESLAEEANFGFEPLPEAETSPFEAAAHDAAAEQPAAEPASQEAVASEESSEVPAASAPAAPPASMSQMLGMSRDFGSFLGGTPLALSPLAPVPPPPPARAPQQTLFAETEVASVLFNRDTRAELPPIEIPVSTPIATAEVTPFTSEPGWKVEPHPDALNPGLPSATEPPAIEAAQSPAPGAVDALAGIDSPAVESAPPEPELNSLAELETLPEFETPAEAAAWAEPEATHDAAPEVGHAVAHEVAAEADPEAAPSAEREALQDIAPEAAFDVAGHGSDQAATDAELDALFAAETSPDLEADSEADVAFEAASDAALENAPQTGAPAFDAAEADADVAEANADAGLAAPAEFLSPIESPAPDEVFSDAAEGGGASEREAPASGIESEPVGQSGLAEAELSDASAIETLADIEPSLADAPEIAASAELPAVPPATAHDHSADEVRGEMFDTAPEALDRLPEETLAPISDVTEAVGEAPAPAPAIPTTGGKTPGRKSASDLSQKPKRTLPPPPARSIRRPPSRPSVAGAGEAGSAPMLPAIDVFSQSPVANDPFSAPEIPPTGFVPPSSGASRRNRPPGTRPPTARNRQDEIPVIPRSTREPVGAARKGKSPRKPAVVEPIYGAEDQEQGISEAEESAVPASPGEPDPPRALPPAPGRKKPKKKWRFPFFGLFMLVLAAGLTAGGVWFLMPARANLLAALRFEKLEQLSGESRWNFEQAQRRVMERDDFRTLAQQIYKNAFHGRPGDGFLYRQAGTDLDFTPIVESARSEGDRLVLKYPASRDPEGDRLRFQAVLKALYTTDLSMRDEAASRRTSLDSARAEFSQSEQKLIDLRKRIEEGTRRQGEFEVARRSEKDLSDAAARLEKIWSDASAATRRARAELDGIDLTRAGSQTAVDSDAQLQQMSQRLKALTATLTAARGARSGDATNAAGALEAALGKYRDEIDRIKGMTPEGSPLAGYLSVARQVEGSIRQIDADLAARRQASQQTGADLNGKLAEKIEAHLKKTWATDPDLKRLEQDLQVQQHRLGAAASAGLSDDAFRIRGQVDALKRAIDGRRDQVAQAANYPEDIKAMQKLLVDQAEQLRGEQARSEQRINEQFKLLAAAAPHPETVAPEQQKLLDGLVDKLVAVSAARQQLSQAAAPSGATDVKALEAQTTELAAQIEARRKQLADAGQNAVPAADSPEILQKRAALDALQQADATAFSEWTAAKEKLASAQATLDQLQSTQPDLIRDNTEYASLKSRYDELKSQIDRDANFVAVVPVDPDHEEGVQISRLSDKRVMIEGGIGAVFCLLALILVAGARRPASPSFAAVHPPQADDQPEIAQHPLTAA